MNKPKEYFDIAVVIPLEEELAEFFAIFPSVKDCSSEVTLCHVVESGVSDVKMIAIHQQGMGKTNAIKATQILLDQYEIGVLVCIGIAGSLSDDMRLGDVCYSGSVIDVLDNNKVSDIDENASDVEFSPSFFMTPANLTNAISFIRTQPELRPLYLSWQSERGKIAEKLVPNNVPAKNGGDEKIGEPTTKGGSIVCGSVSKSVNYNRKLKAIDRAVLAVETESGGIFAQASTYGVPALAFRGISDYADAGKNKLESISKGSVRSLAASNAVSFLKLQLTNPRFKTLLKQRQTGFQPELPISAIKEDVDYLTSTLNFLDKQIDGELRKLSPEYKLQPKGYKLPLPRIKPVVEVDKSPGEIIEIIRALELHDQIVINLPKRYPDQSLAWVVADNLKTIDILGKKAVPIVIDGDDIRGKSSKFVSLLEINLKALYELSGVKIVFVLKNIPFTSKHRIDTLLNEVREYSEAKFIFITQDDVNLLKESDFSNKIAAAVFDICSISFFEITHFIQKNFEMNSSEAEVVALRLRDTFNRFDLDAHPTYFAGIPKETLAALLQANRRSELIQLAVDGFLTFLVAGDKADVTLSRTTRARFLRKLVVEMHVEKKEFSQAEVVEFTKNFAQRFDFDINPIAFIQAFVDQGIMHFEGDKARISLPFIESYLLASELHTDNIKARKYFDVSDSNFDLATFDLYAEIGADPQIIQDISTSLSENIKNIPFAADKSVFLTEEIMPENIKKPGRAQALRKRLDAAVKAVRDGADNLDEKQKIIDLSEKVKEASGKSQDDFSENDKANEVLQPLFDVLRSWAIATVLLGSGAEHLEAEQKRDLSTKIISGAAKSMDAWIRAQKEFDFLELKKQLTSDEALKDMPGPDDIDEKRNFISGFVDIIEYQSLALPFLKILGWLCEQARHKVLATSVENAQTTNELEKILHSAWLADIDPARGKKPLDAAIKSLPQATFLRLILTSHLIARVYWNHWRKEHRMFLLNAAEETIKPLQMEIDKPQLKRLIENSKDTSGELGEDAA